MRIAVFVSLVCVLACGTQEPPAAAPPPTTSAAPAQSAAAPAPSASSAPAASATPEPSATASAAPPAPKLTQTLKQLVGDAKIVRLTWRENMASNEAKVVTIRTLRTIKGILDALGEDQIPSGSTPAYMSTFSFRFEDAKENPLATVSLYSTPTLPEASKKFGRVDVAADGSYAGVTVAKYDELQKKLKAVGVTLP